jgi:hypothetical protein
VPALPCTRVSIEDGVSFGWASWIGNAGTAIGIDR